MNDEFNISDDGMKIVKYYEGFEPVAYLDQVGVPTIGYGHTKTVKKSDVGVRTITKEEASELLQNEIVEYENAVKRLVTVELTQNQFDALTSFAYNLGIGSLQTSTLLKKVNAGDFNEAKNQFMRWINAGGKPAAGLVRRRWSEAKLFDTGIVDLNAPKTWPNANFPL